MSTRSEASNRQVEHRRRSSWSKSDLRYWTDVVYRPTHQRPDGKLEWSEYYVIRIGHRGRRTTFPLGTSNKTTAAAKAREIYSVITANGWDTALAKFKKRAEHSNPVTVGEFLVEAQKHLDVRPKTFAGYAAILRRIAADIAGIESNNQRFDYQGGGRDAWLKQVNQIKLARLTSEKIREWRSKFLEGAKDDQVRLKAARNSVSSFVRAGKALFSEKVLQKINSGGAAILEHSPFRDIKVEQAQLRYRSDLDFEKLLAAAAKELSTQDNLELYKIFLLAATAGLRRAEIDTLQWNAIRFEQNLIRIETTKFFSGKSCASHDDVYLDPQVTALLRGFYAAATGKFVVESSLPPRSATKYRYYRCQRLFDQLISWLRRHGVTGESPIHTLRKEYGSQLTKAHGIFVASRALRHSSVQVTEQFYASQKQRVSLGLGHLFSRPDNAIDIPPKSAAG